MCIKCYGKKRYEGVYGATLVAYEGVERDVSNVGAY